MRQARTGLADGMQLIPEIRRFFCFVHIPKTAGTTFNSVMARNFGANYLYLQNDLYEKPLDSNQISDFIQRFPDRQALGGHRLSLDMPFASQSVDVRAIAFVREPLSRLVSEYYYHRGLGFSTSDEDLKQDTFDKFLVALAAKTDSPFHNAQWKFLNKTWNEIEQLITTKKLLLFTTENFERACICLETLFPDEFVDNSFTKKNVNRSKPFLRLKDAKFSNAAKVLGVGQELYLRAQAAEQALFDEIGSVAEWYRLKKDFRRRCFMRRVLIDPLGDFIDKGARFAGRIRLR